MKWYKKEKHWENYKGERFNGHMNRDLEKEDVFEFVDTDGKKRNYTVKEKIVSEDGIVIVSEGVESIG